VLPFSGLSNAATLTYSDAVAWASAAGNNLDTFTFTGNFVSNSGGATVAITQSGGSNSESDFTPGIFGSSLNQVYQDVLITGEVPNRLNPNLLAVTSSTYTFGPSAVLYAVGATWSTALKDEGSKINIVLNLAGGGTEYVATIGRIDGFFGWISDTPFTSFVLSTNKGGTAPFILPFGVEHYTVDNLQVTQITENPEPATIGMVGLGILGLGAFRRYRSRATAASN
jgi:hypothetical protein